MQVYINDEPTEMAPGATLQAAVEAMGFDGTGVAAALNERVIPRRQWVDFPLHEGARVVVLQAAQGG